MAGSLIGPPAEKACGACLPHLQAHARSAAKNLGASGGNVRSTVPSQTCDPAFRTGHLQPRWFSGSFGNGKPVLRPLLAILAKGGADASIRSAAFSSGAPRLVVRAGLRDSDQKEGATVHPRPLPPASAITSQAAPASFVQSVSHEKRDGAGPEFPFALGDWFTRNVMYSGVLNAIVYVALFCTYASGARVPFHPAALVYGLLGSHVIYNYDRIMGCQSEDDRLNAPGRTAWTRRHSKTLKTVATFEVAANAVLAFLHPLLRYSLFMILLSFLYTQKFLPGGVSPKQLPGLKAFYTAFTCTSSVAFLVNCLARNPTGGIPRVPGPLILASLFFLISAMVNWNDLRDEQGDRLVGTLSLPVLVGGEKARMISAGLFWISSVSAAAGGSWILAPFALMNAVLAATLSHGSKFEIIPRL